MTTPALLAELDTEAIRRELAGYVDPDATDESRAAEYRREAIALIVALAGILDIVERLKMWSRIESALETMCAKVHDGDTDRALSLCATHVASQPGRAAHHADFSSLVMGWSAKELAWRQGLIRYIAGRVPTLITHGTFGWKSGAAERNDAYVRKYGGELSNGEIIVLKGGAE